MTSQFYACSLTLICARSKTAFSAPHSTQTPHLTQMEGVGFTRIFALPDSNTSPRVTISVLRHVLVSQTGIVQVPYATVPLNMFAPLVMALYNYGFGSNGLVMAHIRDALPYSSAGIHNFKPKKSNQLLRINWWFQHQTPPKS